MAWGAGEHEEIKEGAGQTLVHETHAPKRISHIQFGLLNAEVRKEGVVGVGDGHVQRVFYWKERTHRVLCAVAYCTSTTDPSRSLQCHY